MDRGGSDGHDDRLSGHRLEFGVVREGDSGRGSLEGGEARGVKDVEVV